MIRIGIECEQLEGERFGVGHALAQLLETIAQTSGVEKNYRFVLYFKKNIPEDGFLAHPVFEKKILTGGLIPPSFNIFYHILIPIAYWRNELNLFFFPSYMLPAFFIGRSIVVLTNDVYWEAHRGDLPFKYRLAYRLFCWWAAKRATKIMTISEFSSNELRKFYNIPRGRIFVNPWGLEKIFKELPRDERYFAEIEKIKKRFGIKNEFFLSIGQAFPRRHIKEAMSAFASVTSRHPEAQYLIAAIDKYEPPVLENLSEKINKKLARRAVIYIKYLNRETLRYLMNETLALVYVSDKEALGLPPLEALACGQPAIIKDNEISHELFGEEGYFVRDADNPENIAEQMERLLVNEKEARLIVQKQSACLSKYNWAAHIRRLLDIINEII